MKLADCRFQIVDFRSRTSLRQITVTEALQIVIPSEARNLLFPRKEQSRFLAVLGMTIVVGEIQSDS
jgi:hypothetical protein